jgi:hypothetical protein
MENFLYTLISTTSIFIFSFFTVYFYFLIGNIFNYKVNNNNAFNIKNIIYKCIIGLILISFIALITNFFISLNKITNTIIYSSILIIVILIKKKIYFKEIKIIFIVISLLNFLLIIWNKVYTPDAGLYHLPFINVLHEYKIIIGLSNIHFRFGHTSILEYLNAINYNLIFNINGILIPQGILCVLIIIHFFNETFIFFKNKEKININFFFSLFVLIFICLKVSKYSEFGNDAAAHLLFFYLINIFLTDNKLTKDKKFSDFFLISVYIALIKIFMVFAILIPFIIFFNNLKNNFFNKTTFFGIIFIFFWLFKNIIISGCLIYPIEKTCFKVLYWHNNKETIKEKISGEAWAKGWPHNQNLKITQKEFIEDFRWLSSWKYHLIYIIKKLAIFFIVLLLIVIIFSNIKKKKIYLHKKNIKYKMYFVFIICSVGTLTWFIKAPLYRYGFSYTISFLLLIISYLLVKFCNFNQKLLYKLVRSIFFLCIITILLLQLPRIVKNYQMKSYNYWPNIFLLNSIGEKINPINKKIINGFGIYSNDRECWYSKAPCSNYEINDLNVNFYNSYIIISRFVN